jgi:hypothetical protein
LLVAVCLVLAAPAVAAAKSPWQPFRAADFDLPAGSRCPFELTGEVLLDREKIRTNSPTQQEVKGPLVVRYTNEDTDESIVRNLTGRALIDTFADGSSRFTLLHGHLAVGLGAGDPGGPAFLVLSGRGFTVDFAADGTRAVTPGRGTTEDVCETLG